MIELDRKDYRKVFRLVMEVPFNNLLARVVIENGVEGRIFVDNEFSPVVCLVVHKYGMAFLCGKTNIETFNSFLRGFFLNDSSNNGCAKWVLTYTEDKWLEKLQELLGGKLIINPEVKDNQILKYKKDGCVLQTVRVNFKFDKALYFNNFKMPEDFRIERIDKNIYKNITGSVVPEHYWKDADDFLSRGTGYALIAENGHIASVCFTSFIIENKYELGIETAPEYRGKGLGIYPVCSMIDFCLANSYEPIWGCRKENIASVRLAEKVGFKQNTYHNYYTLPVF